MFVVHQTTFQNMGRDSHFILLSNILCVRTSCNLYLFQLSDPRHIPHGTSLTQFDISEMLGRPQTEILLDTWFKPSIYEKVRVQSEIYGQLCQPKLAKFTLLVALCCNFINLP